MTSADLTGLFKGTYKLGDSSINVSGPQVYHAASLAQLDLMVDTSLVDRTGQLAIAAGQQEYIFEALAVTAATAATPIVVTVTGHPYHTGDTVTIFGVLGNLAANGRFNITKIDANTFSLDGSVGTIAYTSGGTVYHDLMAAWELKNVRFVADPYGLISLVDQSVAENHRSMFASATGSTPTIADTVECYQVREGYLRLVFMDVPAADAITEIFYIRTMLPSEKISETVDPILAFHFDKELIQGTRYHLLNNFNDSAARDQAEKEWQKFEIMIKKLDARSSRRRFVRKRKGIAMVFR